MGIGYMWASAYDMIDLREVCIQMYVNDGNVHDANSFISQMISVKSGHLTGQVGYDCILRPIVATCTKEHV